MAKKRGRESLKGALNFVSWLAGIIVSLSVGFTMAFGELTFPSELGGLVVSMIVGWTIVVLTAIWVVSTLFNR